MEAAVPVGLEFSLAPERLDEGSPEERATFGLLTLRTAHQSLTEGFDHFLDGYRPGPLVSGYHVAEWLAWNWWRLRWEPRSATPDWTTAHAMTSIGEGYVWPNLQIWSDGVRTMLISQPSSRPDAKPFRYMGAVPTIVPSTLFEAAIDEFLPRIIGRLRPAELQDTNLEAVWRDILAERADPEIAKRRRLEALMGRDADAIEDDAVEALLADAARLGDSAIDEVAAERAQSGAHANAVLTAQMFEAVAEAQGVAGSTRDIVQLDREFRLPRASDVPAWKLGALAADAVRHSERLGAEALTDRRLAQLAGTQATAITARRAIQSDLSFALDAEQGVHSRVVLRGARKTGRRFDLARLLGDRLINRAGALHPATHAYTYRQKAQRSFAAELLSPFEAVDDMLAGDYSLERQQDVADHFAVSPMVINTLLKNHGRLEREVPDEDFYAAAA